MKNIGFLALTLVLTAAMLIGCGCTNQKMDNTSAPTVLPTNEENWTTGSTTPSAGGSGANGGMNGNGSGENGGMTGGASGETGGMVGGASGENGGTNGSSAAGNGSSDATINHGNGPLEDATTQSTNGNSSGGTAQGGTNP